MQVRMGATQFLTKTLARVHTKMRLDVPAYDLNHLMRILGIGDILQLPA
jgi:hypothetical protein